MVSAGVHGMAAGTSDKAPAPCRTEEPGAGGGCARLQAHTAHRNARSGERGWGKDVEVLEWPSCPSAAENG